MCVMDHKNPGEVHSLMQNYDYQAGSVVIPVVA